MRFLALLSLVSTIQAYTFPSTDCVDAAGTDACLNAAQTTFTGAAQICGLNKDCLLGAQCLLYSTYVNCALSHCWNKVSQPSRQGYL